LRIDAIFGMAQIVPVVSPIIAGSRRP
jgi:hypothetical protein